MELTFERYMPCPPQVAFSLVTDPARINLWSTALVRSLEAGDGGHAAGVGAIRQVQVTGFRAGTLEEIVVASEPPHRFAYRVIDGGALVEHRAEQRFEAFQGGTRLTWSIDAQFHSRFIEGIARRWLVPQLAHSAHRLPEAARVALERPLPPVRRLPPTQLGALYRAAETCLEEQREFSKAFAQYGNPKRWFAQVVQYATENQIEACRRGIFAHRPFVLRLVHAMHRYYAANLRAYLRQEGRAVESHWKAALEAMDRSERSRFALGGVIRDAVGRGLTAQVEDDLPRALADVYYRHYATCCDYVRFRGDYLLVSHTYDAAARRVFGEAPHPRIRPLRLRFASRRLPIGLAPESRRTWWFAAFDRGERIVNLLRTQ